MLHLRLHQSYVGVWCQVTLQLLHLAPHSLIICQFCGNVRVDLRWIGSQALTLLFLLYMDQSVNIGPKLLSELLASYLLRIKSIFLPAHGVLHPPDLVLQMAVLERVLFALVLLLDLLLGRCHHWDRVRHRLPGGSSAWPLLLLAVHVVRVLPGGWTCRLILMGLGLHLRLLLLKLWVTATIYEC